MAQPLFEINYWDMIKGIAGYAIPIFVRFLPFLVIIALIEILTDSIIQLFKRRFLNHGYSKKNTEKLKTYIDNRGYERFSDSGILVHRWLAEKKLGRKLYTNEIVHHINRNKLDNRLSNLLVCKDQDEHELHHKHDNDSGLYSDSNIY